MIIKLNNCTLKDAYPLPNIEMCLDCLSSSTIVLTIGLQAGYWQIEMDEEDQSKTLQNMGFFNTQK